MSRRAAFGLLLAASFCSSIAFAQEPSAGDDRTLVFGPDFFAEARPADAYEMLRRLPGFTIVEGDPEIRGYAAAAGNVLIDGKPPSGKQQTLETLLRRIPAASVLRIELIRGGAGVAEAAGHAIVANVVRSRTVTRRASAEAEMAMARDGVLRPDLKVEGSRQGPTARLEMAAGLETEIDDESGQGRLEVFDPSGNRIDAESRREWESVQTLSVSAAHERRLAGGELNASASFSRARTDEDVTSGDTMAQERERLIAAEGSARWRRGLGTGKRLEALLLHRIEHLRARSREGEERFDEATESSETIGRLSLRREQEHLDLDAALEGALNRLESEALLTENGAPVPLPGSDARVTERRAEASVGATWRPVSAWTLEPRLAIETSRIASTGDAAHARSFLYVKPRLVASLALGSDRLRFGIAREVGQLDFEDFVASASLDRDDVSAGAVRLRPSRSWVLSAAFEHRFWGDGALVLDYRHEWIEDVIDRVAVTAQGETFDAVGNIGGGRRHVGKVELTAPLSRLGLTGVLLRSAVTFRHSRVTDPVTGRRRIISEDKPVEGEIRLSQDLMDGRLTWGVDAALGEREWLFRFDEVRLETEALRLSAYVEYRPARDWRLRVEAANLTSAMLADRREKFEGPRDLAPVEEVERRRLATTPLFSLSVRKSFGGS